jgi:hypothetical protein
LKVITKSVQHCFYWVKVFGGVMTLNMTVKRNLKTGLALAAFWLLPNAAFCQEYNDAGIPSAIESNPTPFTGIGAPPTNGNGSSVFLGNSPPPFTGGGIFRRNGPPNLMGNGPPPSMGSIPPPMMGNGSQPAMSSIPPQMGNSNTASPPTGAGEGGKAPPLQAQVGRLENVVFGHSSDNVPLLARVSTLEGRIFGTEYDTGNKSLEDRVQHLWQTVNPATPQAENNDSNPLAAISAFVSPFMQNAQSLFRIARPVDGQQVAGSSPFALGGSPASGDPGVGNAIGAMGANAMASLPSPPPNFSLSVPTNLFATPPPGPPLPFLNAGVLEFVRRNMGQEVGNGECWTLAARALKFAGAEPAQEYTFGRLLAKNEQWLPGDIIQFTSCVFRYKVGSTTSTVKAGAPNHTAVMWGRDNGIPVIAQQNHNGDKTVSLMNIDLDSLIKGKFQIFRPVPLGPP